MNTQKPTPAQLRQFAVSEIEGDFFRALVENPALEEYVAPFVGLHQALWMMEPLEMYGDSTKIGVHHPEFLSEEAYELLEVLIEWQKDPKIRKYMQEAREALRDSLDAGFNSQWAWEQRGTVREMSGEEKLLYTAQKECFVKFLSISTAEQHSEFLALFPEFEGEMGQLLPEPGDKLQLRQRLLEFIQTDSYGIKWQILHQNPELLAEETIVYVNECQSRIRKLAVYQGQRLYWPPFDLLEICKEKGIEGGLFDEIGRLGA